MSSGVPSTIPFSASFQASAVQLSHLFGGGGPFGISSLSTPSNNRLKVKRCRQRVDAGEPRNSYQSQLKLTIKREPSFPQNSTQGSFTSALSMVSKEEQQDEQNEQPLTDDNEEDNWEVSNNEDAENQDSEGGAEVNGDADKLPLDLKLLVQDNGESRHSSNSVMSNSSSRRKQFQPQRQPVTDEAGHQYAEESLEGEDAELEPNSQNSESIVDEEDKDGECRDPSEVRDDTPTANDDQATDQQEVAEDADSVGAVHENGIGAFPSSIVAALSQNGAQQDFQKVFQDAQRRLYANWLEQQRKQALNGATANYEKSQAFMQLQQAQDREIQRAVAALARSLKEQATSAVSTAIDKMMTDYVPQEIAANAARMLAAATVAIQQQQVFSDMQQRNPAASMPFMVPPAPSSLFGATANPMLNLPFSTASTMGNLLAAMQNSGAGNGTTSSMSSGGIFPTQFPPPFAAFNGQSILSTPVSAGIKRSADAGLDEGTPRKKRSKVTDSVRGPRASAVRDIGNSLPASERSSPQGSSYFPPTMVSHPLYNGSTFGGDSRVDTPGNSGDDYSDFGAGGVFDFHQQSVTLTHVHLRKAKLMFFYTRYPSSAVLKSYFPDIHFNKNNTAQLVKWFSNFREFFYMQMEKYAKQAIAEGIRDKNDIVVTIESEIYKQLNQHYNRNSVIEPPERLVFVVQETLREFFVALQANKDSEPSWKKAIYKVIQQLDEQIPEYFKEANFMETLERQ